MGWSGSCGFVGCWWACGREAVAASRCRTAGRMSYSSSKQWAAAHVLSGEAGGRCGCRGVYDRLGDACGWWRARSAVPFPTSLDPWGVVVMLVVRVVWVLEWVIVPLAVPLVRVL